MLHIYKILEKLVTSSRMFIATLFLKIKKNLAIILMIITRKISEYPVL